MPPFYPETLNLENGIFNAIRETSTRLIRIELGEPLPMLVDFLGRAEMPTDKILRRIPVESYTGALLQSQ